MSRYCFRAECIHDVLNFLAVVAESTRIPDCRIRQDAQFPDCEVEFLSQCSIEELKLIAEGVVDLHVISESLKRKT
jgi:hypothetical protein